MQGKGKSGWREGNSQMLHMAPAGSGSNRFNSVLLHYLICRVTSIMYRIIVWEKQKKKQMWKFLAQCLGYSRHLQKMSQAVVHSICLRVSKSLISPFLTTNMKACLLAYSENSNENSRVTEMNCMKCLIYQYNLIYYLRNLTALVWMFVLVGLNV